MFRKKILIVNYVPLFPKVMASQDRVINLARRLAEEHDVTVITSYKNELQKKESEKKLNEYCVKYVPVKAVNFDGRMIVKLLWGFIFLFSHYIFRITNDYFYSGNFLFNREVINNIKLGKYDIIQIEYWFNWKILNRIGGDLIKVIDTQDILFEKREQQFFNKSAGKISYFKKLIIDKYKKLETNAYELADILISITPDDEKYLRKLNQKCKHIIVATGQNLSYYSSYPVNPDKNTILFYGSMSGSENIVAFWRLFNNIFPSIHKIIQEAKLLVLGANPPDNIKELNEINYITVTGYVDDVRQYLATASIMILPLDVAAGFRSRTVEVMAMGIPIIGTHKALDNINLQNGINGFITDSNEKMAEIAINLLANRNIREDVSIASKKFVNEHYYIENTYGKLSKYYLVI